MKSQLKECVLIELNRPPQTDRRTDRQTYGVLEHFFYKWTGMKEAEGDKSNAQNNSDFNQQQIDGEIVSILEVILQRHKTTLIAQFLISSTFAKHNPIP